MDWLGVYQSNTELYNDAVHMWPSKKYPAGKWILASYDDDSIIVYQAYNEDIAKYACEHGRFIGCPNYNENRMTWIKTNFLWMMYRSRWATKINQQHILAIWLRRSAFNSYLGQALIAINKKDVKSDTRSEMPRKTHRGTIRLQWDPDHYPNGEPVVGRRAMQLGLKKIESFLDGQDIIRIVDVTDFVENQYKNAVSVKHKLNELRVPIERVYTPDDERICRHVQLDPWINN